MPFSFIAAGITNSHDDSFMLAMQYDDASARNFRSTD
jgi:hypothetical protein